MPDPGRTDPGRAARATARLRSWELGPGRIVVLVVALTLAAYAGWRLIGNNPIGVALWFAAAVIGHDLILVPLYSLADFGVMAGLRRFGRSAWIGHVRVPAILSGLLLLIYLPLILDRPGHVTRWLLITVGLFAASAALLGIRVIRNRDPGHR